MEAENEICQCNMKISQLQDPYDMEKDVNYVARKQNSTLQWQAEEIRRLKELLGQVE